MYEPTGNRDTEQFTDFWSNYVVVTIPRELFSVLRMTSVGTPLNWRSGTVNRQILFSASLNVSNVAQAGAAQPLFNHISNVARRMRPANCTLYY